VEKRKYELSTRFNQVLTVVQHQQEIFFPQVAYERVDERAICLLAYLEHASHGLRQELGV
jgi:hypothetical protein